MACSCAVTSQHLNLAMVSLRAIIILLNKSVTTEYSYQFLNGLALIMWNLSKAKLLGLAILSAI